MCFNVILCVINTVVCLTAPTNQQNKDYTHTDIRVVYNVFFWFNNKDRGLKKRLYTITPHYFMIIDYKIYFIDYLIFFFADKGFKVRYLQLF